MFKIDERKELIKGDSKFNKTHISFICSSHSIAALVFQAVNSGLGYNSLFTINQHLTPTPVGQSLWQSVQFSTFFFFHSVIPWRQLRRSGSIKLWWHLEAPSGLFSFGRESLQMVWGTAESFFLFFLSILS